MVDKYEDPFVRIAAMIGGDEYLKVARSLLKAEDATDEEIASAIDEAIAETGAGNIRDMGRANLTWSFVSGSSGWIGLHQVARVGCSSVLWGKFLNRWRPSDIVRGWVILVRHEKIHGHGWGHSSGGIMNPTIITSLPLEYIATNDPCYRWYVQDFGGKKIDNPFGDDPQPPVPQPPSLEQQVQDLQEQFAVINHFVKDHEQRIAKLEGR